MGGPDREVVVASVAGPEGGPMLGAYPPSELGMRGWSRSVMAILSLGRSLYPA